MVLRRFECHDRDIAGGNRVDRAMQVQRLSVQMEITQDALHFQTLAADQIDSAVDQEMHFGPSVGQHASVKASQRPGPDDRVFQCWLSIRHETFSSFRLSFPGFSGRAEVVGQGWSDVPSRTARSWSVELRFRRMDLSVNIKGLGPEPGRHDSPSERRNIAAMRPPLSLRLRRRIAL